MLTTLGVAGATFLTPVLSSDLAPPTSRFTHVEVGSWTAPDGDGVRRSSVLSLDAAVLVAADVHEGRVGPVELRARHGGRWGPWKLLPPRGDHGDDAEHGPHEVLDGVSEPIWVGRSEAVQLRATDPTATADIDLVAIEMEGGDGLAYAPPATGPGAAVAAGGGEIVPRSAWDPNGECRPRRPPEYGSARMASVHHTVMYPHYGPHEADDVVRALCIFHVQERGFDDLGYNFLVDRYGRAYEGRAGGVERPVVGAHAAGFNRVSVGISVIGDFETHPVPAAAVLTVDRLIAWKFASNGVDPHGRVPMRIDSENPHLVRWPQGWEVNVPTIVGHRDTGAGTLCPGRHLYRALEGAPDRVASLIATGPEVALAAPPEQAPAPHAPTLDQMAAPERRLPAAWNPSPLVVTAFAIVALGLLVDRFIGRRVEAPARSAAHDHPAFTSAAGPPPRRDR